MKFIPLYYGDMIKTVNPYGYVGVLTLWSKVDYVCQILQKNGLDMSPETSPIVAIGNLYGNGMKHLLRNLLYNPQITNILVCGKNRSNSLEELLSFFNNGVENINILGVDVKRIKGTSRVLDNLIDNSYFKRNPVITYVGDLTNKESIQGLIEYFKNLQKKLDSSKIPRIEIELPIVSVGHFPSNPRSHIIIKNTPLEAWKELLFTIIRFGHESQLKKGKRKELQSVKVVVENPIEEYKYLLRCGFDISLIKKYQDEILNCESSPNDTSYTYGHRIRKYFNIDGLSEIIARLNLDSQDRKCYLSLWDTERDLYHEEDDSPCMVSLYFRFYDEKLTLTASFRTHNALDAWLINFYGLMAILRYVCGKTGLKEGSITVISHSISVNIDDYDRAQMIANERRYEIVMDPSGYFNITIENNNIVVRHTFNGIVIGEYKGTKAETLQLEIYRNKAVSDIGHAMYLGREIARAEICLKRGELYTQK
ncbi:thymidylate synthase [Desulfocucumis palustris]|uniref:Thymidylate synthase n=1 Tax=Desulfocucumis palustris TaxID=1898651 RepID=A0A2L2X7U0_9FIRM|nr:thymidylate synthase [Desulfocucumis palustris]GBF32070.1 thymidylate synthase [Desulfocucumis palustris]